MSSFKSKLFGFFRGSHEVTAPSQINMPRKSAEELNENGKKYFASGELHKALECFEFALKVKPDYSNALNNRGAVLKHLNRFDEAIKCFDASLAIEPNSVHAHYNRGLALLDLKQPEEALKSFNASLAIDEEFAAAHNSRGVALKILKQHEGALASFCSAIAINPKYFEAYRNKGLLHRDLNQNMQALASFDAALAINEYYADAYLSKALDLILIGNYKEGWKLYEWRWESKERESQEHLKTPLWLGAEDIVGKNLLIYPEQGLGDYIQFCRYAQVLESKGVNVVLEVPKQMLSLISSLKGSFKIIEQGGELPDFDYRCPVMSLPLALSTDIATIPATIPYLFADVDRIIEWREILGYKNRPRIGIAWSGNPEHNNDFNRSITLSILDPILRLPLDFHSIQKDFRSEDIKALSEMKYIVPHAERINDFSDTAALIAQMDLIISVDTSVAHLAGAMGKEVWLLLPFAPDFRWMLDREDTPWYPTATLFRQPKIGDWESVVSKIKQDLQSLYMNQSD